jgi:serine/threonine-protein kinase RsbW
MKTTQQGSFARNVSALDAIFEFISGYVAKFDIAPWVAYALQFAVEEVFTNLVKYDPDADPVIPIRMKKEDSCITVEVINTGGRYFDMTSTPQTDAQPHERGTGGLGLYLVKKMVDEFRYEYSDGTGIITIVASTEG